MHDAEFLSEIKNLPNWVDEERFNLGVERWLEGAAEDNDQTVSVNIAEILANPTFRQLAGVIFSYSPFLTHCLIIDPVYSLRHFEFGPDHVLNDVSERLTALIVRDLDNPTLMRELRIAKRRAALAIAIADITNYWKDAEITKKLSDFSDVCLRLAVKYLLVNYAHNGAFELANLNQPETESGFIVLALGKLGSFELNYSSDIDLIVFYDPDRVQTSDPDNLQRNFVRLTRDLVSILSERTEDGYVFRTDLRLRPDPSSTPLAISVLAAETYYESIGQNWERAVFIKARQIAGDKEAGDDFLHRMIPFVWRKSLDFATIQDIHSIKRQINAHRGGQEIAVEGHNVKLGRGGIREIEFFVQTQQLIWGGRIAELRSPGTCDALNALADSGQISAKTSSDLIQSYWYLRRVEHRLQMIDDQQTHTLPTAIDDITALARFLGHADEAEFRRILVGHLELVEHHYAELFEETSVGNGDDRDLDYDHPGNLIFTGSEDDPETLNTLRGMGFAYPKTIATTVKKWHHGRYRATQTTRAQQILTALMPRILSAFGETSDPDRAFARFDEFLARLPAGIQLFSMFQVNPHLLGLVAEVMGSAPKLADHLGLYPLVLESVLTPGFFDRPPPLAGFEKDLDVALAQARDFEDILDISRRWTNDQRLQLGIQALRNMIDWETIGQTHSDIATAVIDRLKRAVENQFYQIHGQISGAKSAVIAMGKLGGREMTPTSDLDLIFIYDHDDAATPSDGERPLAPSQYFARLSQRLINALTAPTADGKLYEVDMRLRPSGNAGPIASHLSAFIGYHEEKAWTWEHMALSRARVISGDPGLSDQINSVIRDTLVGERDTETLRSDVIDMRERIDKEHHTDFIWEIKYLRGGIVDIEFIAQYLLLKHAQEQNDILSPNTGNALKNLCENNFLSQQDYDVLADALSMWQAIQGMLRLTISGIFRPGREDEIPDALKRNLADATNCRDFDELSKQIVVKSAAVRSIYENIFNA